MERPNISVIGLGKLGSPLLACCGARGFKAIGVDINPEFVEKINNGITPVFEPRLQDYIDRAKDKISATQDYREAVLNSDISFIIVPTPSKEDGDFSTEFAKKAVEKIGEILKEKNSYHLVVLVSTVTPGSCERDIIPTLEKISGKKYKEDFGFCYNPEFIALGDVIKGLLEPDFILIGESDKRAGEILENFYKDFCENNPPIKRMEIVNAEITKISLNVFVTTKISFANMLAELCEKVPGGDVDKVTDALGCDSRIGHKYLKGALGYGGTCFPRDCRAFIFSAKKLGMEYSLIPQASDRINNHQIERLRDLVLSLCNEKEKRVSILGLSFKPNTDVIEESQGVYLVKILSDIGIPVVVYDPAAMERAKEVLSEKVRFASSLEECLKEGDVILLVTPWEEFKNISPDWLEEGSKTVIDCWRMLDNLEEIKEKVNYIAIGRNSITE